MMNRLDILDFQLKEDNNATPSTQWHYVSAENQRDGNLPDGHFLKRLTFSSSIMTDN